MTIQESQQQLNALGARFQGERNGIQWFRVMDATKPGGWYWVGRIHVGNSQYELRQFPATACNC